MYETAHQEVRYLKALLKRVRDTGLIYWEPKTQTGAIAKAKMFAEIGQAIKNDC